MYKKTPQVIIILITLALFINCTNGNDDKNGTNDINNNMKSEKESIKGIYLYNNSIDYGKFAENCNKWGINRVYTLPHIAADTVFVEHTRKNNIKTCVIFPVFFDADYLKDNPKDYCITSSGRKAINDWLHFACQSSKDYLDFRKGKLKTLLETTNTDMIVLDFIRFFVFWEKVYPTTKFEDIEDGCYCENCLNNFQNYSGHVIEEKSAKWIKENLINDWAKWKCAVIENTVKELSEIIQGYDKNLPVAIKTIPWKNKDFDNAIKAVGGQDVELLGKYVDLIIPMTYSHMVKQKPEWIRGILADQNSNAGKDVVSCVQVEKTYLEEDITEEDFKAMLKSGSDKPSRGYILFHYDYLIENQKSSLLLN